MAEKHENKLYKLYLGNMMTTSKKSNLSNNNDIDTLFNKISSHIQNARTKVQQTVDTEMVRAYWLTGKEIVEQEQKVKSAQTTGFF